MIGALRTYAHWLHLRWPAGTVETLPEVGDEGGTNVPGVYVTGDLTGIPLLKFALDSGARVAARVADDLDGKAKQDDRVDVVVVGGGVSGMAAAMEAQKRGLSYKVIEAGEPFFTIVNFPKGKPIYTYPREMTPEGSLQVSADVKEALLKELCHQVEESGVEVTRARVSAVKGSADDFTVELDEGEPVRARRVIVAIGRSGEYRRLDVPGEDLDKVYNRLHDPQDFCGQDVLVVGGGDSALEAATALAQCGAQVTVSYRRDAFTRAKPENVETLLSHDGQGVRVVYSSTVTEIREGEVDLKTSEGTTTLKNDVVFPMIGREAPLGFFRKIGVRLAGEMTVGSWSALALFVLFCTWLYNWKSGGAFSKLWYEKGWFPTNLASLVGSLAADPTTLMGTIVLSAQGPSFWYTLAYSSVVVGFGIKRIRKRRTPYITRQTLTLMGVQVVPLFLLPEIILPQLGYHGLLPAGTADALFPEVTYGHGREYWRAYGLILAWPLNVYNVITDTPLPAWLWIAGIQTLVLIPLGIYYFGKGVYCGWICSCGALAETLGDGFRHKMPHGPKWNRLNLLGQGILAIAVVFLLLRIAGWIWPDSGWLSMVNRVGKDGGGAGGLWKVLNWKWTVDVLLAGILGYGLYFWYSGRMWCRFACPLAALMHIYARFSRFRILADKKKCISCNVCTSVCHQGIDIMNFANKGDAMEDPECVRCSACVYACPTGVLEFGQVDGEGNVISTDRWAASPVRMREDA